LRKPLTPAAASGLDRAGGDRVDTDTLGPRSRRGSARRLEASPWPAHYVVARHRAHGAQVRHRDDRARARRASSVARPWRARRAVARDVVRHLEALARDAVEEAAGAARAARSHRVHEESSESHEPRRAAKGVSTRQSLATSIAARERRRTRSPSRRRVLEPVVLVGEGEFRGLHGASRRDAVGDGAFGGEPTIRARCREESHGAQPPLTRAVHVNDEMLPARSSKTSAGCSSP